MKHVRKRLTYANVMSSIAVFLVLGGATAFAAMNVPANSVGTPQLKKNAVKTGKVAFEAIRAGKLSKNAVPTNRLRNNAVAANKIADAAVLTDKLADEAVASGKLAKDSVLTDKIANDAVTTDKIAANAVTTGKIAANAVTQAKLSTDSVGSTQLKGITTVSATSAKVANGAVSGVTATCPSGEVISGGFETETSGADKWTVKRLLRVGNGWRVFGVNESGGESTITAFVYCLVV